MAVDTIKQGDSLFYDFTAETENVDSEWGYWSGRWAIVKKVGEAPLINGDLTKAATPGLFQFRGSYKLAGWSTLPSGPLTLVTEFVNERQGYKEERHDKFTIAVQGIQS